MLSRSSKFPPPRFPAPRRLPAAPRPPRCGSSRGAPGLDRATPNGALRLVARAGDELASAVPNSAIPSSNPKCQPGLFFFQIKSFVLNPVGPESG